LDSPRPAGPLRSIQLTLSAMNNIPSTESLGFTRRLAWTLGVMSAFGPLAIDMYLPGFPGIAKDLDSSMGSAQMTLAIFLAGLAVGQILWGTLSDHAGRRMPLLAGCLLSSGSAIACATTHSISTLIVARFFMGLGGSAGVVVSRASVRDLFEEKEAAGFYAMMMMIGGIGPIVSPFLGSLLLGHFSWRAIFWTITIFGVLCLAAVLRNIPETLTRENRVRGHLVEVFRGYGRVFVQRRFLGPALAIGCTSGILFTYIANSSYLFIGLFGVPVAYLDSCSLRIPSGCISAANPIAGCSGGLPPSNFCARECGSMFVPPCYWSAAPGQDSAASLYCFSSCSCASAPRE
jgi:Bcr/CflA subfamily drug resistance transporter